MNPISPAEALEIGIQLKVDWTKIDLEQFRQGMQVELERSRSDGGLGASNEELLRTGRITLEYLKEAQDYYQKKRRQPR